MSTTEQDIKDQLHPIFRECCAIDVLGRYDMTEPFVVNGRWYATDGGILVRAPAPAGAEDTTDRTLPDVEDTFPPLDRFRGEPLQTVTLPETEPTMECSECKGKGRVRARQTCPDCDGYGWRECDLGHEHDCDRCDERGWIRKAEDEWQDCEPCKGKGAIPANRAINFGCVKLAERYLRTILKHGGTVYPHTTESHVKPVYFRIGDDIDGLLMPRRDPPDECYRAEDLATEPTQ